MNRHSQEITDIEVLEVILGLLRITKEYILDRNKTIKLVLLEEMSMASILAIHNETAQAVMLKSMVLDPEDLMVTRQNLKTGRERSNYSLRVTELQ